MPACVGTPDTALPQDTAMNIHCVRCGQPVRTTNLTCCNMQYALDGTAQPIGPSTEEALRAWLAHKNSEKPEGPPAAVSAHEIEEDRLRGVLSEAHLGALDARVHNASLQRRCAPCAHHDARHDDDAGPFCSKGAECHDGQDGADLTLCPDYTPTDRQPDTCADNRLRTALAEAVKARSGIAEIKAMRPPDGTP